MPPANKCANGKWKWGETGACKYDSKKQDEDDHRDYRAVSDIDFTPTEGMIAEAKKGKERRAESGTGGNEVGLKTANMIIENELTPVRTTRRKRYLQKTQ